MSLGSAEDKRRFKETGQKEPSPLSFPLSFVAFIVFSERVSHKVYAILCHREAKEMLQERGGDFVHLKDPFFLYIDTR